MCSLEGIRNPRLHILKTFRLIHECVKIWISHDYGYLWLSVVRSEQQVAPTSQVRDRVILDDITLNEEMREFWSIIQLQYGSHAVNAVDVIPSIRRHRLNPGFGVLLNVCDTD